MAFGNEAWCGMVDARSVRARVGGCLELEFRKILDAPRSCHARGQGPADDGKRFSSDGRLLVDCDS